MTDELLFEPITLAPGITLRNRVAMAPMTTWASNDDGTISADEDAYYRRRAGAVGLVITGCTHVQANGVGFTGEFAAAHDRFIPSLARLAAAAKSGGAPVILQLYHAGVKISPDLVSNIVAASAVEGEAGPFAPAVMPRALHEHEIEEIVRAFGEATRRAIAAGFDGVELHGAHGFLIQNFLSPHFNRRSDRWGGALENRMRFPLAIVAEVRRVIAARADRPFALGYRITADEPQTDGLRIADSLVLIDRLIGAGIDYLHASLGAALDARPHDAPEEPTTLSILIGHIAGRVPIIAAGQIGTADAAGRALAQGLSIAAVGQSLVMNPDWVARGGRDLRTELSAADVVPLGIPAKLWAIIQATPGWFKLRQEMPA